MRQVLLQSALTRQFDRRTIDICRPSLIDVRVADETPCLVDPLEHFSGCSPNTGPRLVIHWSKAKTTARTTAPARDCDGSKLRHLASS